MISTQTIKACLPATLTWYDVCKNTYYKLFLAFFIFKFKKIPTCIEEVLYVSPTTNGWLLFWQILIIIFLTQIWSFTIIFHFINYNDYYFYMRSKCHFPICFDTSSYSKVMSQLADAPVSPTLIFTYHKILNVGPAPASPQVRMHPWQQNFKHLTIISYSTG